MEVAAYLSDKASSVTVIGNGKFPFQSSLGTEIGKVTMQVSRCCSSFLIVGLLLYECWNNNDPLLQMLEEKNVKFYMSNGVTEIRGENGKVSTSIKITNN